MALARSFGERKRKTAVAVPTGGDTSDEPSPFAGGVGDANEGDTLAALRDAVQIRDPDSGETCDEFTTNLLKWKAEPANSDALHKLTTKLRHTRGKAAAALFDTNNDTSVPRAALLLPVVSHASRAATTIERRSFVGASIS